ARAAENSYGVGVAIGSGVAVSTATVGGSVGGLDGLVGLARDAVAPAGGVLPVIGVRVMAAVGDDSGVAVVGDSSGLCCVGGGAIPRMRAHSSACLRANPCTLSGITNVRRSSTNSAGVRSVASSPFRLSILALRHQSSARAGDLSAGSSFLTTRPHAGVA